MVGIDYRALRDQISMRDVLAMLGFKPIRVRGSQLRGPCPVHGSTASSQVFSVHLEKQAYRCFACGSCGNQLDLWSAVHRLSLHAAAHDLCDTAGITPPKLPCLDTSRSRDQKPSPWSRLNRESGPL